MSSWVRAASILAVALLAFSAPSGTLAQSLPQGALFYVVADNQAPSPAAPSASQAARASNDEEEEQAAIDRTQPDFTLVNLPTTRRLPKFKSEFRVTHRFGRSLSEGSFADLAGDFFGLDSGAQIGLEYRFGIFRRTQIGVYRTSDKTIDLFGEYNVASQTDRTPVGVLATFSVDGTNNFRDEYSPAVSAVISRTVLQLAAFYVAPTYVGNTNAFFPGSRDTFLIGLGARLRVRPSVYLVGEFEPRVSGYRPQSNYGALGVEKLVGGHVFQLNVSNAIATTPSQLARGGSRHNDWYLGFNISRKFF